MADRRIRPPKDKEALIVRLTKTDDASSEGIFQTRAHLMTFAAIYGFSKQRRIPFADSLEPIRHDVFARHGHDTIINLLALAETEDPRCLAQNDEAEHVRATIFEEYANGGLDQLRGELQGVDLPLEHLMLMIQQEQKPEGDPGEFDLSRFLS